MTPPDPSLAESPRQGDALVGTLIGGRYKVTRVLGAGGMGVVVEAFQADLDQHVAVKVMLPEHAADAGLAARFLREARIAAKARSPHLVRVFDVGRLDDGAPYLVMELLAGHDLRDELARRGPLPVSDAVDYVLEASLGLAEIHALGIVHRDLKPSNLFLSEEGGKCVLRVLDLGISKETTPGANVHLTSTRQVLGTPHYMSPEQIRETRSVDARSDVWSLGVILYELLTGELPFASDTGASGELFGLVLFTEPRDPRRFRPDLPPELQLVIMRCLQRERDARFGSVADLAEALGLFASPAQRHRVEAIRERIGPRRPLGSSSAIAVTPGASVGKEPALNSTRVLERGPERAPPPHTAVPWSTDSGTTSSRSPRPWMVVAGVGAIVAVSALAGVAFLTSRGSHPDVEPVPAASPSVESKAPPPAPSAPPPAAQESPSTPVPPAPLPSASAPPAKSRSARPPGAASPARPPAPRPTPNVDSLIEDRR